MSQADGLQLCSLYDQRVQIINETLYLVGGSYLSSRDRKPTIVRKISKISLASEFMVDGLISQTLIETQDAPDELTDPEISNGGIFFYDERSLWAFGAVGRGDIPTSVNQTDRMYRYDAINQAWTPDRIEGGEYQWFNNSNGFHAAAPDGRNWYGGGTGIGTWAKGPGLILFEGNETIPKWSFIKETDDLNSIPTPSTLGGASVFLPIGEEGVIVLMGGFDTTVQGSMFQRGSGLNWDLRSLSDIFVYDIARNYWSVITASGTLPEMRAEFCLVVNSSPDGSYHNIIMYGGWNQLLGRAFADVWVLSLPSFRWIKVEDENNPDTRPFKNNIDNPLLADVGRTRHRCRLFKNTQMIVSGGIVTQYYDKKLNIDACNSSHPPLMVMDTSSFVWKASITPDEQDYEIPSFIRSTVRDRRSPDDGWPNDRIGEIFSAAISTATASVTTASATTVSAIPTSSSSETATSDPSSGGLSTGALVGIAIGGVAILILFIAGFILLRRRRKLLELKSSGNQEAWSKAELAANSPRAELPTHFVAYELPASPLKEKFRASMSQR